jgi:hypothetical protein
VRQVALARRRQLPARSQPLQGVLADRLQQPEARAAVVAADRADQALVDQRDQGVEDRVPSG